MPSFDNVSLQQSDQFILPFTLLFDLLYQNQVIQSFEIIGHLDIFKSNNGDTCREKCLRTDVQNKKIKHDKPL